MDDLIGQSKYGVPFFSSLKGVRDYAWGAGWEQFSTKGDIATITTPNAFNVVYGPGLTMLAYDESVTLNAIGEKPAFLGLRYQEQLSSDTPGVNTTNAGAGVTARRSGVTRAGNIPVNVLGGYEVLEFPYKQHAWHVMMDLGMVDLNMQKLGDVLMWQDVFENENRTFLYDMNGYAVARIEDDRDVGRGVLPYWQASTALTPPNEVIGMESIDRIISNMSEADALINDTTITGVESTIGDVSVPWKTHVKLPSTDQHNAGTGSWSAIDKYRNPMNSDAVVDNNFNCYVDYGQVVNGYSGYGGKGIGNNHIGGGSATAASGAAALTDLIPEIGSVFSDIRLSTMVNETSLYRKNRSSQGLFFLTGMKTIGKIQQFGSPLQRYIDQTFVQFGQDGARTIPGQNIGINVSKYLDIPLVPDKQIGRGVGKITSTATDAWNQGVERLYLVENTNLSQGILSPIKVSTSDDPIITQSFNRRAIFDTRREILMTGERGFRATGAIKYAK